MLIGASFALTLFAVVFIIPPLFSTSYTFQDEALHAGCWIYFRVSIPYDSIYIFREENSYAPSPALSHNRIFIQYVGYSAENALFVSPVDKLGFIAKLEAWTKKKIKR